MKLNKLLNILTYKRPAGSKSEKQMIKKYIDVLPNVRSDKYGNRIVQVGEDNTTMFSCHTDTVHSTAGKQKPLYDKARGEIFVNHDECLGADDAAGIMCLIMLIDSGVNGLYVFHREEEIGGKGSAYIRDHTPELLNGIERCIAFDRRGNESIITHQGMERCCSEEFTEDLAQKLMAVSNLVFFPDDTGSFTDSANYTDIIPECTKVSCGYTHEHSPDEVLDISFLTKLVQALVQIDFDDIVTVRDPKVPEYKSYRPKYNIYDDNEFLPEPLDINNMTYGDILDYVYDYPESAAQMLQEYRDTAYFDYSKYAG